MSALICTTKSNEGFNTISLYDVSSEETLFETSVEEISGLFIVSVNSQATKVFVGRGHTVSVYCIVTSMILKSINIGTAVEMLRVNNSGTRFVTACGDFRSRPWIIWDVETGSSQKTTEFQSPKFSCDDRFIVAVNIPRISMQVWDDSGNTVATYASSSRIGSICVHPFKPDIVGLCYEEGWAVWDFSSNDRIEIVMWCIGMRFSRDDDIVFVEKVSTTTLSGVIVAISISSTEELFVIHPPVKRWIFDFNPSDDTLVLTSVDSTRDASFFVFSSSSGELLYERKYCNCRGNAFMRAGMNILL